VPKTSGVFLTPSFNISIAKRKYRDMEQIYRSKGIHVVVPPGNYLISDPCYLFSSEEWSEAGESNNWFSDSPIAKTTVNGKEVFFLGFNTTYGDGEYRDNLGNLYDVDSGMIGLIPMEVVEQTKQDISHIANIQNKIVTFDAKTLVSNYDGEFEFGSVWINTNEDNEEEYEDECGYDD
jgi:hypothetical protein